VSLPAAKYFLLRAQQSALRVHVVVGGEAGACCCSSIDRNLCLEQGPPKGCSSCTYRIWSVGIFMWMASFSVTASAHLGSPAAVHAPVCACVHVVAAADVVLALVTMWSRVQGQFYKTPRRQELSIYSITSTWRHHEINQHHHALKLTPGEMLADHSMIAPTINQPPSL
jgi:hypothetical protein